MVAVTRSGLVVIDSREQGQMEAGDLIPVVEEGRLSWEDVVELADVVAEPNFGGRDPRLQLFNPARRALEFGREQLRTRFEPALRALEPAAVGVAPA